jgi:hypothetical protein
MVVGADVEDLFYAAVGLKVSLDGVFIGNSCFLREGEL